jgi:hypothetical protein
MAVKQYKGSGIVWDKKNNKPLCRFPKGGGILKTGDKTVQDQLEKLGFAPEVVKDETSAKEPKGANGKPAKE